MSRSTESKAKVTILNAHVPRCLPARMKSTPGGLGDAPGAVSLIHPFDSAKRLSKLQSSSKLSLTWNLRSGGCTKCASILRIRVDSLQVDPV